VYAARSVLLGPPQFVGVGDANALLSCVDNDCHQGAYWRLGPVGRPSYLATVHFLIPSVRQPRQSLKRLDNEAA
jgi:hypothetical protein